MKTCEACGLPAPTTTEACALCAAPFPSPGPSSFRLARRGADYRWSVDGEVVATASLDDGRWEVVDAHTGTPAMTLIPVLTPTGVKVAVADHRSRRVTTFFPGSSGGSALGMLLDGFDRMIFAVRGDGPTGIHVINPRGDVVALASRVQVPAGGLDVLVTDTGAGSVPTIVFGLLLAVELAGLATSV